METPKIDSEDLAHLVRICSSVSNHSAVGPIMVAMMVLPTLDRIAAALENLSEDVMTKL